MNEKKATCPDCGGTMKETAEWWFTCGKCGAGHDGSEVEWKNGSPMTTINFVYCPKCHKPAGLNKEEKIVLCPSCGVLKVIDA
jgi:ribosomal protein S27AE